MAAGTLRVDNIDVFCEEGVFDLDSTRSILEAGKELGLNINFHGDELHPMNAAQVPSASQNSNIPNLNAKMSIFCPRFSFNVQKNQGIDPSKFLLLFIVFVSWVLSSEL